jgi:hypothetical protein
MPFFPFRTTEADPSECFWVSVIEPLRLIGHVFRLLISAKEMGWVDDPCVQRAMFFVTPF